jgi:hypothetical protein
LGFIESKTLSIASLFLISATTVFFDFVGSNSVSNLKWCNGVSAWSKIIIFSDYKSRPAFFTTYWAAAPVIKIVLSVICFEINLSKIIGSL